MAYIEFDHVVKEYPSGSSVIRALDEASFTADAVLLLVGAATVRRARGRSELPYA